METQRRDPMTITVHDIPPSLNAFYGGRHWTWRKRVADQWHQEFFCALVSNKVPRPLKTPLILEVTQCSPRIRDCDNAVVSAKFFLDTCTDTGYIPDDSPEYVSEVRLKSMKGKKLTVITIIN